MPLSTLATPPCCVARRVPASPQRTGGRGEGADSIRGPGLGSPSSASDDCDRELFREQPRRLATAPNIRLTCVASLHPAYVPFLSLWLQPGQQHGRRFPSARFSCACRIRFILVSSRLASSIQQIHSLRASGVMSCHASRTVASVTNASRKSSGNVCTVPVGTSIPAMLDRNASY